MVDYKIFERIEKVEAFFEDEASKIILRSRILFNLTGDIRCIHRMLQEIQFPFDETLDEYYHMEKTYGIFPEKDVISWIYEKKLKESDRLVLFGCGYEGKNFISLLEEAKYPISYVVDNNKTRVGADYFGYSIVGIESVPYQKEPCYFIITAPSVKEEIKNQLKNLGIEEENIYVCPPNALMAFVGNAYFEPKLFKPTPGEVFIDAGCYNGGTCLDFAKWNPDYKKIYAFEPGADNFKKCEHTIAKSGLLNVELRNTGLWKKAEELHFSNAGDHGTAGHIEENGEETIICETLDSLVLGDEVTFIKMDIEGAEMQALEGSKETIIRCKPKLAICVYHLNEDILDIPEYIHSLVPEYKMLLKHYNSFFYDTVLYAWIE